MSVVYLSAYLHIYYIVVICPPLRFRRTFIELMKFATISVEFSFDNIMYREIDGVSSGTGPG